MTAAGVLAPRALPKRGLAFTAALLVAGLLLTARSARAEDSEEPPPARPRPAPTRPTLPAVPSDEPPTGTHWYGKRLLFADAVGFALAFVGFTQSSAPMALTGLVTFAAAPPVMHAIHGNLGRAGGSAALRIGLPVIFSVMSTASEAERCQKSDSDVCSTFAALGGAVLGMLTAAVIDQFLAVDWHEPGTGSVVVQPVVQAACAGALLGLGGRF